MVASCTPPTGDLARNPGMCPDWESNSDPLVHRPVINPLGLTSQGKTIFFLIYFLKLLFSPLVAPPPAVIQAILCVLPTDRQSQFLGIADSLLQKHRILLSSSKESFLVLVFVVFYQAV